MNARYWLAALTLTALAACGGGITNPTFKATLNGANERPNPVTTSATGSATVTLNESAKTITVDGSYTGVTATAAHIHGLGGKDAAVGVVCTLGFDNATGKISAGSGTNSCASLVLTDAQVTGLKTGQMYVNIHSTANSGGEIRGQLE